MTTQTAIGPITIRPIDLEELGAALGVPVKVRPWWGSCRGDKSFWYRQWFCSARGDYYSRTPPRVVGRVIVVHVGRCGVKWGDSTHKHRQWVNVVSVQRGAMLLEICVGAGPDGYHQSSRFLIGVDGARPYVVHVGRLDSVEEAFQWLKPAEVIRAERLGLDVKRQGEWFFIPSTEPKRSLLEFQYNGMEGHALYSFPYPPRPTRHYAEEIVHSAHCQHRVRGRVHSPDHEDLVLEDWHTAVQNTTRDRHGGD